MQTCSSRCSSSTHSAVCTFLKCTQFLLLSPDMYTPCDTYQHCCCWLQAFGLDHFELLLEKALDTRVLLAWGPTSVVLSFRGTSSWTNLKADLSAWLTGEACMLAMLCRWLRRECVAWCQVFTFSAVACECSLSCTGPSCGHPAGYPKDRGWGTTILGTRPAVHRLAAASLSAVQLLC
jgi:hypothetical protein